MFVGGARETLTKLLALFTPSERRRGVLVVLVMLTLAVVEIAGVASVMPFLAVLGDPTMIETNWLLAWLFDAGGFQSTEAFLYALGAGAFALVMLSAVIRIAATYLTSRYTQMRRHSIGRRLLQAYLRQPYEFFLNRNSADLSKSILSEVDTLINQVVKPAMDAIAYGLVMVALGALLVAVDPYVAALVGLIVGGAYLGIYWMVRGPLGRMGNDRVNSNRERFAAASEAFGGIKELKVLGREQVYLQRFEAPSIRFARHHAWFSTLSLAPKFLIEAVGFGSLLGFALYLMVRGENLGQLLPMLGLYAFAGYRLLPAAQHVYASVSALRFGLPAVHEVYDDLTAVQTHAGRVTGDNDVALDREVSFVGVSYTYPGAPSPAVHDVTLTIGARSSVALVGPTGSGKTTLVDLLLGLVSPTDGQILIDGERLDASRSRAWLSRIGYVPQSVYLADASIAANIAFGLREAEIDPEAVERAARIASLDRFIAEDLPRGYQTRVGERGVRLSGGQRQRIGIARALYHDPQLLVLDEATSALDSGTERAIMDAMESLAGVKTIVMIAHRISTVRGCDQIVVLGSGHVVNTGTYDELCEISPLFRQLATT